MALHGGRTGAQLTITDALTTGYRFLLQPNFSIPILVIGAVVNLVVIAAFVPLILKVAVGDSTDAIGLIGGLVAGVLGGVIAAIIGGIVLNLYGQVWAVMARTDAPPTIQAAFARVGVRWMSVLGAGMIVGAIELGGIVVLGIVAALLGPLGALLFLVGLVAIAYVGIRLSMAGWLAAEGSAAVEAVKASWEITNRNILVIIGWSLVIGVVVALITAVLGIALNLIPLLGPALTQTIGSAFGFGAGVTLFGRVRDD